MRMLRVTVSSIRFAFAFTALAAVLVAVVFAAGFLIGHAVTEGFAVGFTTVDGFAAGFATAFVAGFCYKVEKRKN
jgi:hypothetical protein